MAQLLTYPSMRRMAAVVAAVVVLAAGAASADDGETVRLSYDAYVGPFYVVSAEAELRLDGDRYRVVTRAQSEGLAGVLFSWQSEARSEGRFAGRRLQPRSHEMDGQWSGEARQVRLSYDGAGPIAAQILPPPDLSERDPVPAALTADTVDPLSATLDVLLGIAGGARCEGEYRVFDGRRRYDMLVSPGASADLPRVHSSVYAGPAQRCEFRIRRIAGFMKKQGKLGRQVTEPVLYVASPMPGVPPVPVRFTAETGFGDLRIHLTRVQRGRTILALPQS
jgi:hypothetical protein